MCVKEIAVEELEKLKDCLEALAQHHNEVSLYHSGFYPSRQYAEVLEEFKKELIAGTSMITAVEVGGEVAGFCKIDVKEEFGKLDYLIVSEKISWEGLWQSFYGLGHERISRSQCEAC